MPTDLTVDEKIGAIVKAALEPLDAAAEAAIGAVLKDAGEAEPALRFAARVVARAGKAITPETIRAAAGALSIELPTREVVREVVRETAPGIPADPVFKAGSTTEFDLSGVADDKRDVARAIWGAQVQARAAEERAAKVAEALDLRDAVARAERELGHLPGATPDQLGGLLVRAKASLPEAAFDHLVGVLKSASAALGEGALYRAAGRPGTGGAPSEGAGAYGKLRGLAKARADASGGKLTIEGAIAEVLRTDEGMALYAEDQQEKQAAAR